MYDYVSTKPELNEETLTHYGIKGMKWRKKLTNGYNSVRDKLINKFGKNATDRGYSGSKTQAVKTKKRGYTPAGMSASFNYLGGKNYLYRKNKTAKNLRSKGYDSSMHATISGHAGRHEVTGKISGKSARSDYTIADYNRRKEPRKANKYYFYNASNVEAGTRAGRKRVAKRNKRK